MSRSAFPAFLVAAALTSGTSTTTAEAKTPVWLPPVQAGQIASTSFAHEVRTTDLDGDGLRDVILGMLEFDQIRPVPPVFLLNQGSGRFTEATASIFEGEPPGVEWNRQEVVADFNGDHRPDVFIADMGTDNVVINPGWPGQQNKLILSTPAGKLRNATANLPQRFSFTHSAAAADVDGDGDVDLFENNLSCCGRDRTSAILLLNDGSGRFSSAAERVQGVPRNVWGDTHSYAVEFADVNRDSSPDLVVGATEQSGPSVVLLNDGRGSFGSSVVLPPKLYSRSGLVIDIVAADLDGDADADLVMGETQNEPYYIGTRVQVLINDGRGTFSDATARWLPTQPEGRSWPNRLLTEDLDDDGRPDLTVQYAPVGIIPEPDPTRFWLNRDGAFAPLDGPVQGTAPTSRGVVAFVNGAGPHAFLSIEARGVGGAGAKYFISRQLLPPIAPSRATAARSRIGVRLSWAGVPDASQYEVWRGQRRLARTARTTFTDRRPLRRITGYRVRAVNAAGMGPFRPVTARR
jgi:hypothetical protein